MITLRTENPTFVGPLCGVEFAGGRATISDPALAAYLCSEYPHVQMETTPETEIRPLQPSRGK